MTKPMNERCAEIADKVVPQYRAKDSRYSCTSWTGKQWTAAWDAACIALGGKPENFVP